MHDAAIMGTKKSIPNTKNVIPSTRRAIIAAVFMIKGLNRFDKYTKNTCKYHVTCKLQNYNLLNSYSSYLTPTINTLKLTKKGTPHRCLYFKIYNRAVNTNY
ncbi:hypothetical protein A0256_01525 [Mucilaginibacter sp. PAMC 26640]|nr:hypothetical protein A0256_01525 [Mucilaginibacter sp. PAMC 26640]